MQSHYLRNIFILPLSLIMLMKENGVIKFRGILEREVTSSKTLSGSLPFPSLPINKQLGELVFIFFLPSHLELKSLLIAVLFVRIKVSLSKVKRKCLWSFRKVTSQKLTNTTWDEWSLRRKRGKAAAKSYWYCQFYSPVESHSTRVGDVQKESTN